LARFFSRRTFSGGFYHIVIPVELASAPHSDISDHSFRQVEWQLDHRDHWKYRRNSSGDEVRALLDEPIPEEPIDE